MATLSDIGLSQPAASTITMKLRTTTLDVNSTVVHSEVLILGDTESTLGLARVIATDPASTTFGLVTREARRAATFWNSTCSTLTSTASSAVYTIVAASASTRVAVYAFALASTGDLVAEFMSSGAGGGTATRWAVDVGGGISGGNLAVTPPARLFQTEAGEALSLRLTSTGVQVRYSVAWFVE